jgi:hypothetical protein
VSKASDARLKASRAKLKLGIEADKEQAEREKVSLRMYALEQWPEALLTAREAQQPSGTIPGTPARPCIVVDKLREPVAQVVNQERESDLSVELVPADDFGGLAQPPDPAEIELREGLIRRIQRESESGSARTWAFERAAVCGRGYYAINTRYVDGKTFDQEVYCRRLYHQGGVVLDPAHEEPDGSDAEWGFLFTILSYDAYRAEFPEAAKRYGDCNNEEWLGLDDAETPGWFTCEGDEKYIRVAEEWSIERTSRTLCHLEDGSVAWKDEVPQGAKSRAERTVIEKSVRWCRMDGCQILDETDWPSPYIPIVKVVGNEIPPYDEQRRVDGMVNKSAIESQRGLNYMVSKLVEEIGLSAVSPLMVVEGTIEGYEGWWNQANMRAFPYLPYKMKDLEGNLAPSPHRPDKSVNVAPVSAAIQMFVESIQASTGPTDPAMGKPSRYSETWRGTQALINQSQRGTSNYMDNFTRSVRYEGRIINSLLYPIYGNRPGRMARIVKGEGNGTVESETVVIGRPFMMQDNGQGQQMPVPAPPGANPQQDGVRQYTLTPDFKANVAVKVTKGFDTRRQEEAAMLGDMISQNPEFMAWFGDKFLAAQDWPGAKQASERAALMLAPPILAHEEQKKGGGQPLPPMALQQMQQLQQQNAQLQQAAQQMQQDLQAKVTETQIKIQGEQMLAKIKADAELRLAQIKADAEIRIAQLKAGTEVQNSRESNEAEMTRQALAHAQNMERDALAAAMVPDEPAEEQV